MCSYVPQESTSRIFTKCREWLERSEAEFKALDNKMETVLRETAKFYASNTAGIWHRRPDSMLQLGRGGTSSRQGYDAEAQMRCTASLKR